MDAYLQPVVSWRLYTTIIWHKRKIFEEAKIYGQKNVYV